MKWLPFSGQILYKDIEHKTIRVRNTTLSNRTLTLHDLTQQAIDDYIAQCPYKGLQDAPYLFLQENGENGF